MNSKTQGVPWLCMATKEPGQRPTILDATDDPATVNVIGRLYPEAKLPEVPFGTESDRTVALMKGDVIVNQTADPSLVSMVGQWFDATATKTLNDVKRLEPYRYLDPVRINRSARNIASNDNLRDALRKYMEATSRMKELEDKAREYKPSRIPKKLDAQIMEADEAEAAAWHHFADTLGALVEAWSIWRNRQDALSVIEEGVTYLDEALHTADRELGQDVNPLASSEGSPVFLVIGADRGKRGDKDLGPVHLGITKDPAIVRAAARSAISYAEYFKGLLPDHLEELRRLAYHENVPQVKPKRRHPSVPPGLWISEVEATEDGLRVTRSCNDADLRRTVEEWHQAHPGRALDTPSTVVPVNRGEATEQQPDLSKYQTKEEPNTLQQTT